MDPVKQKLILLKKLANEKKYVVTSNQHEDELNAIYDSNSEIMDNEKPSEKINVDFENDSNISDQKRKESFDNELNNKIIIDHSNIEKEKELTDTKFNDKSNTNFEEEEDNEEYISNNEDLDILKLRKQSDPGLITQESNSLNSKSNQSELAPSKYVNRIKDFYDKERASSVESIHLSKKYNLRQPLILNQSKIIKQMNIIAPESSENRKSTLVQKNNNEEDHTDQNLSEFNENFQISNNLNGNNESNSQNSELDESISCISNIINTNSKTSFSNKPTLEKNDNRYIKHLRDSFNLLVNDSLYIRNNRNKDQLNKNFTSSFNLNSSNTNQIEKLREKFNKQYSNTQPIYLSQKRTNSLRNTVLEANTSDEQNLNNSKMLSLKSNSMNDDDYRTYTDQFNNTNKEINSEIFNKKENTSRNLHRYQKSKTLDLSDAIFNQNENRELINEYDKNSISNYNKLIGEINLDSRYNPENAIIKSTLSFDNNIGTNFKNNTSRTG
jgi:hypothetical protein